MQPGRRERINYFHFSKVWQNRIFVYMLKISGYLLLLPLIVAICSCSSTRQSTVVKKEQPVLAPLPDLPSSSIQIPVHINLKPLLQALDKSTPVQFTSDKWPDYFQPSCDFRYKYRFARSPFVFNIVNNKVSIRFRGNYQIAGSKTICAFNRPVSPWVSGSCGFGSEPLRRVDLNISSTLSLNPDLTIRTRSVLDKLQPLDRCEVSLLQTDMTGEIMDSIRSSIETYCQTFDEFVNNINSSELLVRSKQEGSKVMPISDYGFLNLNPTTLRVGPLNYSGDSLRFSLGFWGTPEFSSDSLRIVRKGPLPPLRTNDVQPGIDTYLNAVYDYSFFNKLLNDSLQNKPFELEGRTFVIKHINIQGTDQGKLMVDVSFTGNRTGVLRLSGTPVLDRQTQTLTMPDISFGVDTRDIMINIGKSLFRKKIIRELKDQSVFDIAELINNNRELISARLNQPVNEWMSTRGDLKELQVIGIRPQQNSLQLQLYIKASLMLIGTAPASAVDFQ